MKMKHAASTFAIALACAALPSAFAALAACRSSSASQAAAPDRPHDPPRTVAAGSASATTDPPARKEVAPLSHRTYTKPSDEELRRKLTPLQYEVTQREATEPPFRNTFWDNHAAGLYVDVATGEPLFASTDKFESGTGWPSFTRPVEEGRVTSKSDMTYGMVRTEVRSHAGSSHLGHVFDDGPAPTGQRYCINSAALRFVPVERLQAEGYGEYLPLFSGGADAHPPADTANACATPAPGERPGCEATLETALLTGDGGEAAALRSVPGVLEVEPGTSHDSEALRVTFDPSKLAYRDLLDRWASTTKGGARVAYWVSDEQRKVAEKWARAPKPGFAVKAGDASAFSPAPAGR
jgi:peptide methionine sulfoxide reductase msrA/msrB